MWLSLLTSHFLCGYLNPVFQPCLPVLIPLGHLRLSAGPVECRSWPPAGWTPTWMCSQCALLLVCLFLSSACVKVSRPRTARSPKIAACLAHPFWVLSERPPKVPQSLNSSLLHAALVLGTPLSRWKATTFLTDSLPCLSDCPVRGSHNNVGGGPSLSPLCKDPPH